MEKMTQRERFISSLKKESVDKVPVCAVTQTGIVDLMELSGAEWPEANYDPEKMATLAIAAHELAGLEAVRIPFCTSVIAETLGCIFDKGSFDTQPYQLDFPCKTKDDIKNIVVPEDFIERPRIRTVLQAARKVRERIGDETPIIAGVIGPAATAFYLSGANNYLMWCIKDENSFKSLVQIGTEACLKYANALYDHGVDAVVIIDSEAGPDILPPALFESMILPEYHSITSQLTGLKILHICGDTSEILDNMANSGFDGLSIEEKVDIRYAKQIIGERSAIIGNISPSSTLLGKSPDSIKKEAKQCIEDGIDILAPGCGLAPHTSIENLKAFVAARDEYYREKSEI
jgi:[methyl-Co(III) methanol-specific corrinoid protein]:coenzyme M methyltransferase